jgi:nucleotide-binding universal stress UspA family protein
MARRVLVPLDGSPGSETALDYGVDLARAEDATLRLLHVAAPPRPLLAPDGKVLAYADQVGACVAEEARDWLTAVAARVAGCEVETAVRFGDPADEILDDARGADALLIAMATHRRRGIRRLVEGSVAERVERQSPVPVLLLEHGEATAAGPGSAVPDEPAVAGRLVHRRFWCPWSRREVEVTFVERGLPGLSRAVSVDGCSAFDPPSAVACQRSCVDATLRRPWLPLLPVDR